MDPRPGVTPLEPEFKGGDIEVGTEAGLHKANEVGVGRGNGHDGQRRGQPSEIVHGLTVAVAISRSPSTSPSEPPIGIARLGQQIPATDLSRGRKGRTDGPPAAVAPFDPVCPQADHRLRHEEE
jgi:hypothetical protein